jgi:ubiquinone/menaquinone biosynthesis C-methylase UbiE
MTKVFKVKLVDILEALSKKEIKESYDFLGGRIYDIRYSQEQEVKYQTALKKVSPNNTDIILDNGCGTGLFLTEIESNIIGIDISQELLKQAIKKTQGTMQVHLVQADSETLPLRALMFDKVYSFTVIHNLNNRRKGVAEMIRVSRKDASLVVTGLKKAFQLDEFQDLFKGLGVKTEFEILDTSIDYFVYIKKNERR